MKSGKVLWSTARFGAGSVTLAGNRLLIVRETGELVLATASPSLSSLPRPPDPSADGSRLSGDR